MFPATLHGYKERRFEVRLRSEYYVESYSDLPPSAYWRIQNLIETIFRKRAPVNGHYLSWYKGHFRFENCCKKEKQVRATPSRELRTVVLCKHLRRIPILDTADDERSSDWYGVNI